MEESPLKARVRHAFSERGILATKYPGYERRDDQARMALDVAEALESGKPVLIEAGTGIGKSLAYLVPIIYWATENHKRAVISTYTKALQDQLFTKDLPTLQRVLGMNFAYSCLFGSENYVSLRRLNRSHEEAVSGLFPAETARGLASLMQWAQFTQTGLKMEIDPPPNAEAWSEARRDTDDCMGKNCPSYQDCFYFRARRRAFESHILVVNHSLLFAALASGWWVFPCPDAIVLDEAHTIEDVASESAGMRLTRGGALRLMTEIMGGRRGLGLVARLTRVDKDTLNNISHYATEVHDLLDRFFQDVQRTLRTKGEHASRFTPPLNVPSAALSGLKDLAAYLKEGAREATNAGDVQEATRIRSYVQRVERLAGELRELSGPGADLTVYWAEWGPPRRRPIPVILRSAPLEVGPYLRENLFVEGLPVVLTSATLTVAGSFEHLRRRIGLDEGVQERRYGSPFDYPRIAVMWTPTEIPDPREAPEEYASAVEENLLSVLRVTSGATMVLCTSYDMVRRLTVAVGRERPDLRVFSQEASTGAGAVLKKFRRARNAVLIGTSSFWQGVDLPGETLICVVITRLPFEVPDNPMVEARCDWIEKNGGNPFFEYSLPNAVLMFRQGFGRLIRTRKDWGVFAVLDPRLKTRRYGRTFVRSLPNLFQTDDLQAVAAFVAYHRNRTNPQDDGN